ncbi:GNAT family N-acetyltransferase [Paenibacillus sp. TH7-28]
MNIRAASEIDFPEIRQIYLESRRGSFHWAKTEEMNLEDFDRDTVEELIIIAEEDSHILGFASLYLPENFIHNLFVHPDFFGRGVGEQLLHTALTNLGRPVRLKCVSANHKAMKFYEKHGWKKIVEEGPSIEKYWVMEYK